MKEKCQICGKEKELVPDMVICSECKKEVIEKNFDKRYHPTEIARKLDDLEKRVKELEMMRL